MVKFVEKIQRNIQKHQFISPIARILKHVAQVLLGLLIPTGIFLFIQEMGQNVIEYISGGTAFWSLGRIILICFFFLFLLAILALPLIFSFRTPVVSVIISLIEAFAAFFAAFSIQSLLFFIMTGSIALLGGGALLASFFIEKSNDKNSKRVSK